MALTSPSISLKSSEFREGLQNGVSIALAYAPVAMTFGLLAKSTGLSFIEAVMMSVFVFAGAAQFITLSLIASGTAVLEIIFTIFIVNIRHLLMSASLSEKAVNEHPIIKAIYAFGITDETFSVASLKNGKISSLFMFGLIIMAYGSWVLNTGVGYIIGESLPDSLQESLSIAIYAMFVGLLVPTAKKQRTVLLLAATAALLNSILTLSIKMSSGWAIILSTLIASIFISLFSRKKDS